MKLELKHLAPYLPYDLKMTKEDWGKTGTLVPWIMPLKKGLQIELDYAITTQAKPILRPLSDLTKKSDGSTDRFWDYLVNYAKSNITESLCWKQINELIMNHYDVFGLIENNLAIDINLIENVSV